MNELVHFNRAKQELALATKVDEVKEIRDRAEALRVYIKQTGEGLVMQNQCAEIKIRAERRAGEMLETQEKHKGGPVRLHDETTPPPKLKDLGIDKNQSSRWQEMASIPGEEFEEHIATTKESGKELTSIGVQKLAKAIKREEGFGKTTPVLPEGKYNILLVDCPWRYDFSIDDRRKIEKNYPTMTLEDIKEMEVPASDNAVLFLWAPAPKLLEALEVMESWGFEYKTNSIWDKELIGMGYWFRGQHELLLVGTKGTFSPPTNSKRVSSVHREKRTEHSRKPDYYYELIEDMFPTGKYLELFARNEEKRNNWTYWGNEIK